MSLKNSAHEEDGRRAIEMGRELFDKLKPVHLREHTVDDKAVNILKFYVGKSIRGRGDVIGAETRTSKGLFDALPKGFVVVDNENIVAL